METVARLYNGKLRLERRNRNRTNYPHVPVAAITKAVSALRAPFVRSADDSFWTMHVDRTCVSDG